MNLNISESSLIACLCEGGAEMTIMDILLDNNLLIFSREQLLEEQVLPRVSVRQFERRYLRREYDRKLIVLRIIDSRAENFRLSEVYRHQVDVVNVITAPEIEILVIVSLGKYGDYCRSNLKKPSEYCKSALKLKNVKSPAFVSNHFSDPDYLIQSIKEYHRVHRQKHCEFSLFDLIRDKG